MGIVSTERDDLRRQNNVTDVAFGRFSSSHSFLFWKVFGRYPVGLVLHIHKWPFYKVFGG